MITLRIAFISCVVIAGALLGACTPEVCGEEGCDPNHSYGRPGGSVDPPPLPPNPVVSINERGAGIAAYAQDGSVVVRRLAGIAGFDAPAVVASGFEEDLAAVAAGSELRLAWR